MNLKDFAEVLNGSTLDKIFFNGPQLHSGGFMVVVPENYGKLNNSWLWIGYGNDISDGDDMDHGPSLNLNSNNQWLSSWSIHNGVDQSNHDIVFRIDFEVYKNEIVNVMIDKKYWETFDYFDEEHKLTGFIIDLKKLEEPFKYRISEQEIKALESIMRKCYGQSKAMGWHSKPRSDGDRIALMHSELSEALEYCRKGGKDDHLPQYDGQIVEYADCIIRILDTCGLHDYNVAQALADKLAYNRTRADHQPENREKEGGKKF